MFFGPIGAPDGKIQYMTVLLRGQYSYSHNFVLKRIKEVLAGSGRNCQDDWKPAYTVAAYGSQVGGESDLNVLMALAVRTWGENLINSEDEFTKEYVVGRELSPSSNPPGVFDSLLFWKREDDRVRGKLAERGWKEFLLRNHGPIEPSGRDGSVPIYDDKQTRLIIPDWGLEYHKSDLVSTYNLSFESSKTFRVPGHFMYFYNSEHLSTSGMKMEFCIARGAGDKNQIPDQSRELIDGFYGTVWNVNAQKLVDISIER